VQLTLYTDYSLRTLVYLSLNQDRSTTISEIAEHFNISRNHLVKVVHNLSSKNYILSSRGKGGGLKLARAPELIKIGDVILDTEPNFHMVECFNPATANNCSVEPICRLKSILGKTTDQFLNTLNQYNISDVLRSNEKKTNSDTIQLSPEIQKSLEDATDIGSQQK